MTPPVLPGPALLFCPADRPDRYAKALAAADGVILDLEDGVGPDRKDAARAALAATDLDPARVIVRVNAAGTVEHASDMAALRGTGYRLIMLPKSESRVQLDELGAQWQVTALCETPLGIVNAAEIAAAPNVIAVMWGAEDLIAAMHGRTSRLPGGQYRDVALHARSAVLLAAAARGRPAIERGLRGHSRPRRARGRGGGRGGLRVRAQGLRSPEPGPRGPPRLPGRRGTGGVGAAGT